MDFLRLPYFMKRRNAFREDEREKKVQTEKNNYLYAVNCCFSVIEERDP